MGEALDLSDIATTYARYAVEAYAFVGEGLRHAGTIVDRSDDDNHHLTASELVAGVIDLAAKRFGMLGVIVLRRWGVHRSEDIGAITFHMIEHGIFGKQPSDRIEDFDAGTQLSAGIEAAVVARLAGGPEAGNRSA